MRAGNMADTSRSSSDVGWLRPGSTVVESTSCKLEGEPVLQSEYAASVNGERVSSVVAQ